MKYYQSDKKPLNYFERQKKRRQLKKYRYYFFDYMYYCGEKWSEKGARTSGSIVLYLYWVFCIVLPSSFCLSPMQLLSNSERVIAGLALFIIPPFTFCLLRYRKEYRSAVMNHYRRSEWFKGIPVWLICSGWLPFCIVEFWVLIKMGWI
ncbi:hypothetical protein [Bacteroides congonensis]|uniref:hypothetical protein n=1 Tax=Bacteroides congonensis TaxID=1871006 RepID=UPI00189C9054|nr:hypothetical protein [Bacteroides congonensis]